jgi:ABC-type nickel/cobalt efflux system permease component RcnA
MKSKIHEYQNKYLAMSKISKIIFAIAIGAMITVTSCRDTKKNTETTEEHGHEHDTDGGHMHDETIGQEEFQVEKDSTEIKTETHKHEDGAEHHDH